MLFCDIFKQYCRILQTSGKSLLPCLQTIRVSERDSRTVIGRTRHVTSPIWSRIDWLAGPKIRIVGLSFADVKIDETVHLEFHLSLFGRSKHQFKQDIFQFYDSWKIKFNLHGPGKWKWVHMKIQLVSFVV